MNGLNHLIGGPVAGQRHDIRKSQRRWKRGTSCFVTFAGYFDPTWEPLFDLSTIVQIGPKEVQPSTSVHGFETSADPGQQLVV